MALGLRDLSPAPVSRFIEGPSSGLDGSGAVRPTTAAPPISVSTPATQTAADNNRFFIEILPCQ
jgi:hypothetical protein